MIDYRTDIQGMRAMAVLLVYFAHADISILAGGFVGVDVFFVISGYVISNLLIQAHEESGGIHILSFYANRMLRLFPAMIVMLVISLLLSFYLMPPSLQHINLDVALSVVAYFSNFFFLFQNLDYFNPTLQANLFLHTWSLSVEEQFYLVWPFILLWLIGSSNNAKFSQVLSKAFLVIILSYLILLLTSLKSDMYGFYLMPARMWQFMLGGLIAYIHIKQKKTSNKNLSLINKIGSLLGLVMIITASVLIDDSHPYPGWRVLWPSIGAAMLLFFYTSSQDTWVSQILSIRPMVWMGNISYSFYLWHWVVLVLIGQLQFFMPWLNVWFGFFSTLILALISYHLIENPIRHNNFLRQRPRLTFCFVIIAVLMVWFIVSILRQQVESYNEDPEIQNLSAIQNDVPNFYKYQCDTWYHSSEVSACWFGEGKKDKKVVLFGDSIGAQWFPLITSVYPPEEWFVIVITKSACPTVEESYYYSRIKSEFTVCNQWRKKALAHIKTLDIDVLVLGSADSYPFTRKQWQDGTHELIQQLLSSVKKIKILAPTPQLSFNAHYCLSQAHRLKKIFSGVSPKLCAEPQRFTEVTNILSDIADKYYQVDFLNFNHLICPGGICKAMQNEVVTYRDDKHLTSSFIESLTESLKIYFVDEPQSSES